LIQILSKPLNWFMILQIIFKLVSDSINILN